MPATKTKAGLSAAATRPRTSWNPASNPAVAELLDHLAEELAREYVRLMQGARKDADLEPSREEA